MIMTRRDFLKISGTTGGVLTGIFAMKPFAARAADTRLRIRYARQTTTVCPYCGCGCGQIVSAQDGKVINIEGDPDHPINQGALCSKGGALYQVANNERRLTDVLYRAPGSNHWEKKSWNWAIERMSQRIKETRDATLADGRSINRVESIAALGGAALDNEECYLYSKFMRALGVVYLEHQARLCHSASVAGLAESFGRGAMTNHFIDIRNADRILIIGSNAAENHPMSFRWVTDAIDRGAQLICVDPRFTRTASKAHVYAAMRSGTDIAFVNGMIQYVLEDMEKRPENYNMECVREYTNAAFLINPTLKLPGDADGVFSGYDPEKRVYAKDTWTYQLDEKGVPKKDKTLQDPNCVFQLLKKHMARYTPDRVGAITGTPKKAFLDVCRVFAESGRPDKAGTILYAMGTTQHTHGTQNIRAYSILQSLLGNMGIAGGGINALRGESNVQGSTDMALLFHIIPGYLRTPDEKDLSVDGYCKRYYEGKNSDPKSADWWSNARKYLVSLLKAWYGPKATPENDFAFGFLPKRDGNKNYSHIALFEAMDEKIIKGMICMGQNPAVGGPNAGKERLALHNLDWLICADLWNTETANFWQRPEDDYCNRVDPKEIKTEVFLLPGAASVEKEGSITNSGRWIQWRYPAVHPPGDAKSDLWMLDRLFTAVRKRYQAAGGPLAGPITDMAWDYGQGDEPDAHLVAKELNGYDLASGKLVPGFPKLAADGSTSAGNWLYCGAYTEEGNLAARRNGLDTSNLGLYSNWSYCWPMNRRILYNRASVNLKGVPFDKSRVLVAFKGATDEKGEKYVSNAWIGDVPDGGWFPLQNPDGTWRDDGKYPFIMRNEGHARLFGADMADGPFPEHYEPAEGPMASNPMGHGTLVNPAVKLWHVTKPDSNFIGTPEQFPIVATTFRVTEHWQAGAMTRNLAWLCELMPEVFVEMSEELAQEKGVSNGDYVVVTSARGKMRAKAAVTPRFKPFRLGDRIVHQIGIPWHWGYEGLSCGGSANSLSLHVGDANTMIPEYKAFLCNVRKEVV